MVPELSQAAADLLFLGLDHGIDSVRVAGGPMTPFVVTEVDGERHLQRFVGSTLDESIEAAVAAIRAAPPGSRSVLVYDGYLTVQGQRSDGIFAELRDEHGVTILAQRYRPKRLQGAFETIGSPGLVPGPGKL